MKLDAFIVLYLFILFKYGLGTVHVYILLLIIPVLISYYFCNVSVNSSYSRSENIFGCHSQSYALIAKCVN